VKPKEKAVSPGLVVFVLKKLIKDSTKNLKECHRYYESQLIEVRNCRPGPVERISLSTKTIVTVKV